jgi:hypothetical protein
MIDFRHQAWNRSKFMIEPSRHQSVNVLTGLSGTIWQIQWFGHLGMKLWISGASEFRDVIRRHSVGISSIVCVLNVIAMIFCIRLGVLMVYSSGLRPHNQCDCCSWYPGALSVRLSSPLYRPVYVIQCHACSTHVS